MSQIEITVPVRSHRSVGYVRALERRVMLQGFKIERLQKLLACPHIHGPNDVCRHTKRPAAGR